MNIRSIALTLPLALMASGCAQSSNDIASKELPLNPVAAGHEAGWAVDNGWLTLSPDHGPVLNGQALTTSLRTEYGDLRGEFFVTFDGASDRIVLIQLRQQKAYYSSPLSFAPEGLCLYQPVNEGLQLFVLGGDHLARHYLITPEHPALLTEIRSFPLPPDAEYCTTSDQLQQLFVNEETMGIWSYPANAEKPYERSAVALSAPFGNLPGKAGGLAIRQNLLVATGAGEPWLATYDLSSGLPSQSEVFSLPADVQPEGLSLAQESGSPLVTVYDEHSGQLLSTILPGPVFSNHPPALEQVPTVVAQRETDSVRSPGDAADDPAIWLNHQMPEASRILGTDKQWGLEVYNLQGERLQAIGKGRLNNVDLRYGVNLKGNTVDIAAASHRDLKAISLFAIDPASGSLSWINDVPTTLDDVYGLCMAQHEDATYVFINDQDGRYEQYRILTDGEYWHGKLVRAFRLPSQPEGCVANDQTGVLFMGEEAAGVWRTTVSPDKAQTPELVIPVSEHLVADVEGLALYQTAHDSVLVVSSQGNDSYALFEGDTPYHFLGRFRVGMNSEKQLDGASETDGLEVTSARLGSDFPEGMLVVQDGRNRMPTSNQNFKLISWSDIRTALSLTSD